VERSVACLQEPNGLGYTDPVPTVHAEAGFSVRVLNKDHFPAHVHVIKAGAYAKIQIAGKPTVYETNMSKRDSDAAIAIVTANLNLCRKHWKARYGSLTIKQKDKPKPQRP
jgi:hypothetical protein